MIQVTTKFTCDKCGAIAELEGNKTFDNFDLPLDWSLIHLQNKALKDDRIDTKGILCPVCSSLALDLLIRRSK